MDRFKNDSSDPIGLSQEDLETLFQSAFEETLDTDLKNTQNKPLNTPLFDSSFEPENADFSEASEIETSSSQVKNFKPGGGDSRIKSPLRMKYEAEVKAVKKSCGDLEDIRRQLGLSKRKMAQLLLVDPSAWTRWTSEGGEAPPHIFRALQWYLLLQEKHPQYQSALWLNAVARPQLSAHEVENIKSEVIQKAQVELEEKMAFQLKQSKEEPPFLIEELQRSRALAERLQRHFKLLILGQALCFLLVLLWSLF